MPLPAQEIRLDRVGGCCIHHGVDAKILDNNITVYFVVMHTSSLLKYACIAILLVRYLGFGLRETTQMCRLVSTCAASWLNKYQRSCAGSFDLFQIIKDYHLFGIIMFLWAFDCIILTSWTAMHSLEKENIVVNTKVANGLHVTNLAAMK